VNRAGMLRIAAFGIIGLGAALLIAALLLSTYTAGKIKKIPLNIDEALVSDGTGTALDPASLSGRAVHRRQERAAGLPAADHRRVARQRRRRHTAGRHLGPPHRQAARQRSAAGDGRHRHPEPQQRARGVRRHPSGRLGAEAAHHRGRQAPDQHRAAATRAWPTGSRSTPRRRRTPTSIRSPRKPFDANYDGEEDVNGLTTYRFTQNVGYDADGKLVEPIKYASLYDKNEDAR